MIFARLRPLLGALAALAVSLTPPATATDLPVAGMNLDFVDTYSTAVPFANAARQGFKWVGRNGSISDWYNSGISQTLDADGYPTDWQAGYDLFLPVFEHANVYPTGQYRLSWSGAANLVLDGGSLVSSGANWKIYNVTSNRYDGLRVMLPNGQQGNSVSNIRLEIPGHHNSTSLFNSAMLAELGHFGVIRMMDWMRTNNSTVDSWDDRTKPSRLFWSQAGGVPYEAMVALANELDSDLWICVPHAADNDYVTKLAQLLRYGSNGSEPYTSAHASPVWPGLEAGRRVWIEYSNETWSPGIPGPDQYNYINNTLRPAYGLPNVWQAYGRRARELFVIFEDVFDGTERLVRVVSGQGSTPHVLTNALVQAGDKADVGAIASYVGGELGDIADGGVIDYIIDNNYSTSIYPDLWQAMRNSISGGVTDRVREHVAITRAYGIPLVTYEGGPGLTNPSAHEWNASLTSFLTAFHAEAEWGEIVREHADKLRAEGVATHVAYEYVRSSGRSGYFGHKTHQNQPLGDASTAGSAHKLRELIAWTQNPGPGPAPLSPLAPGESLIIDNVDSDFVSTGFYNNQTWGSNFYGANWGYREANHSTVATAKWIPRLNGREGRYLIEVSRGGGNRTNNQPFTIVRGQESQTIPVNLASASGTWASLGEHTLLDLDRVETTNQYVPGSGSWTIADAVRFTKVADGTLTLATAASPSTVNLATQGALDWVKWGRSGGANNVDRKSGANLVGSISVGSFERKTYATSFSWTGGSPTTSGNDAYYLNNNTGTGFSFKVPAVSGERTLRIYLGVYQATGTLTATLSDGSATAITQAFTNTTGTQLWVAEIDYSSATAGATLDVTYKRTSTGGNVKLGAVALSGAAPTEINLAAAHGSIAGYTDQQTGNEAVKLIDGTEGQDANRWSAAAAGFPKYVDIDLGATRTINSVVLDTYLNRDYRFTIQGKVNSGDSWTTHVDASTNTDAGPIARTISGGAQARYIRLNVTGAATSTVTWVSIRELKLMGTP